MIATSRNRKWPMTVELRYAAVHLCNDSVHGQYSYILYVMFFGTIQIPRISINIDTVVYMLPHAGDAIHPA